MPVARFTKAEVERAVKAAQACGLTVAGVEIEGETIRVLTAVAESAPKPHREPKRWAG